MRIRSLVFLMFAACTSVSAQERVDVTTANGVRFAAQWTDAGKDAPVALFFPMCWATPPETWAPVAAALKSRGVSALVTTYPGWLGNSPWPGPQPPPEPQTVYWNEQFRQVREAAFAFISGKTNRHVVVGGSSCGVERALDLAADHPDRVVGVIAFAGAHAPRHIEYVRSERVPVLGLTSRAEGEWVTQHALLVSASGHAASRVIIREEAGHGTVLLKDHAFAMEIAAWISDRLMIRPLEFDGERVYASSRVALERRGTPIGARDMLIAAHARAIGATCVTDNVAEFKRLPSLKVENWLR